MRRSNLYSSAFWLFFSVYIATESYRLGLGNWHDPGPGYFPFGAAMLLGCMAVSVLVNSLRKGTDQKIQPTLKEKFHWTNVIMVLTSMVLYTLFLNTIGFVLCTFLIIVFFVKVIALQRWTSSIAAALGMAAGSYLLFSVFLKAPLPKGFFLF
jgi:putative tricarboxylic transport membrane protein